MTFDLDWVAIYLYSLADGFVVARLISMKCCVYYVHLSVSRGGWFHDDQWYISMLEQRSSTNLIHLALWVLRVDITILPVLSPAYSLPTGPLYGLVLPIGSFLYLIMNTVFKSRKLLHPLDRVFEMAMSLWNVTAYRRPYACSISERWANCKHWHPTIALCKISRYNVLDDTDIFTDPLHCHIRPRYLIINITKPKFDTIRKVCDSVWFITAIDIHFKPWNIVRNGPDFSLIFVFCLDFASVGFAVPSKLRVLPFYFVNNSTKK